MAKPKVRLGLYGCGNRTQALLDSLICDEEFDVVAGFDVREDTVREVCERYGGKACASADELVSTRDVDAFVISLTPFAHPEAFYKTAEAGKPIFLEKPVAVTAEEAHWMMKTAEERKVPVQVGLMRRYMPSHVFARKFLAENDPGHLFSVSCRWTMAGECELINCQSYHRKFEGHEESRGFRLQLSQIPFHCCHALDVMRLYAGEVKAVEASGIKVIDRPYPSPDEVIAKLEYESGAIGCFHFSSMAYRFELSYLVHTENFSLALDAAKATIYKRPPYRTLREDKSVLGKNGAPDCRPTYMKHIGPETHEFKGRHCDSDLMSDFLNSARTGEPMKVTMRDGFKVAELAEAIETSWAERRRVELPLKFG